MCRQPSMAMAGIVPYVGFLGSALLLHDINFSCARLGPARQRRGRFGWLPRSLGLAHAVVLVWSCKSAGAGVTSHSDFFVVISCGVESGVAAIADRFCPVRRRPLIIHCYFCSMLPFVVPHTPSDPFTGGSTGRGSLSWSFDHRDSLRRG